MDSVTRRAFLKSAALVGGFAAVAGTRAQAQTTGSAATEASGTMKANVAGSDVLRVGIIGSGGRGTNAALDSIRSSDGVEIVAIGDAFMDRAEESWNKIKKEFPKECKVTRETLFDGLDNYEKVLKTDCDLVILAAPPGFRPLHLRAAVDAGKHIFAEKPVCIDPTGYRNVIETAKMAKAKNLAIVGGTQRRHSEAYNETIKRIQDGAIGDIVGGQCYWMQEGLWVKEKKPEWSDTEWMLRNWLYFDWTSGDHIVEQHVHNIDIMNWAMGGPPEKCIASGGRNVRTEPKYGNIYDHFDVELEYPNGVRIMSMSRQWENTSTRIGERLVGTKGTSDPSGKIEGANPWTYEGNEEKRQPYVTEHKDLIASIRAGEPLNELERVADSCLTAVMGRMAAYTGQSVSFRWAARASELDLMPKDLELGPREIGPVPKPGVTKLV